MHIDTLRVASSKTVRVLAGGELRVFSGTVHDLRGWGCGIGWGGQCGDRCREGEDSAQLLENHYEGLYIFIGDRKVRER